jgi:hypothetical protein
MSDDTEELTFKEILRKITVHNRKHVTDKFIENLEAEMRRRARHGYSNLRTGSIDDNIDRKQLREWAMEEKFTISITDDSCLFITW